MQIFLAHAEVDKPLVRLLYQRLREAGLQPWIDDEDIIPGQNKREQIPKAIKESDLFIACLSSRSVNQIDGLMRQLRQSLDRMAEMPPGEIYLIPLKLDPCEIPDLERHEEGIKLQDYQSLDYFAEDGLARLLKTIRTKSETVQKLDSKADFSINSALIRFDIPFKRNQYFTGRQGVIDQLHATLSQTGAAAINQVQAVYGLGGIGKTQTAVEYAYRYFYEEQEYEWVFWVNGETEINLREDYGKIAGQVSLGVWNELDKKIEAVKQWLQNHENWLLIFDNAGHPEWLEDFIPPRIQGKVLITSRASVFDMLGVTEPVALASFETEEAVRFLYQRLGRQIEQGKEEDIVAAAALAEELGYLPLALEQAAAFILRRQVSFEIYLKKYQKQKISLLEKAKPQQKNYPKSVSTTWSINFEQVQENNNAAAELLKLSAFLAPDAIPYELLFHGVEKLGEPLTSALAAEDFEDFLFEFSELLEPLAQYSLIQTQPDNYSYSIHRMVQEVARDGMSRELKLLWIEKTISVIAEAIPGLEKYENWFWMARLFSHAIQGVEQAILSYDFESESLGYLLNQIGYYLHTQGKYYEAEPYYQQSLAMSRKLLGSEHPYVAATLNNLAETYSSIGKYEAAESYHQMSLAVSKKLWGNEDPAIATILNNLAVTYHSMDKYQEAESHFQQSLAMRRKLLDHTHPDIAQSCYGLARLYYSIGKYVQAEHYYHDSLKIAIDLWGNNHPYVAKIFNALGAIYYSVSRYDKAKFYVQQSLDIRKKVLGENHPDVAHSLNSLARLHKLAGSYEEAECCYLESLQILSNFYSEHPDIATILNNLALLRQFMGRYEEAENNYQLSLRMANKFLGKEHSKIAEILNNLAGLFQLMNRYEESENSYQRSLRMAKQVLGPEHPHVASSLNNLAGLYQLMGNFEKSIKYFQRAIAIAKKSLGENHPNTKGFMTNFNLMLKNAPEDELFRVLPEEIHSAVRALRQSQD